ncbi:unnamed protein product [Protopolystoma xenopodis]|uniref:Uncharacterized protein n=1 Tax=Protopolystoma xenopodis TaxID=117903 RepID=A0A3S5AGL1_9PLAT|nr:unnamed protein product [Protopolystoma xenopodis]
MREEMSERWAAPESLLTPLLHEKTHLHTAASTSQLQTGLSSCQHGPREHVLEAKSLRRVYANTDSEA